MGLMILFVSGDGLHLNPAQRAATPFLYDIVGWHAGNFLDKWVHRALEVLPWNSTSDEEQLAQVREYFELGDEAAGIRSELDRLYALGDAATEMTRALEMDLAGITSRRGGLRADVEERIESMISSVAADEGLGLFLDIVFPPVDIRLTGTPKLLVTSPRDRILRSHEALLESDVAVADGERIEERLLEESNLSALVLNLGGVATYPASVPDSRPLRSTLHLSAHEWIHHYLFFRPLGQNMFKDGDIQSLNETVADLAGREIGDRVFENLGGDTEPRATAVGQMAEETDGEDSEGFDFNREMHATRLRVDELLAAGRVDEAEAYMEERRILFVENGFYIRKLNQAFFAFHGTYAESPASVSPIGDQVRRLRALSPDLGSFIKRAASVSSYDGFLERLAALEGSPDG